MSYPDLFNGMLEAGGGFFIWLSIIKLGREKVVRGVSWMHVAFFSTWGIWNLFYYPHLGQWLSFFGGALLVIFNVIWLCQIMYYNRVNKLGWHPSPDNPSTTFSRPRKPMLMVNDQFGGFDLGRTTPRYRHSDK
jgi:hypothetical protein